MKTTSHLKSTIIPWPREPIRYPPLWRCLLLVPLVLVCFGLVSSTTAPRADAAGSGSTTVFRLHGLSAFATFEYFSPDGCIETFVSVDGTQSTPQGQEAGVFIGQLDLCGRGPFYKMSTNGSSFNPIFQINNNLSSASLSARLFKQQQNPSSNRDIL
jgi:hypothetical protein